MSEKVRRIYDALDHGNWKDAIKQCTALMQKSPNNTLTKALYAVALERSGRRDEALQVCKEVQAVVSLDSTVLNTLQVVYRRCRQMGAVTQMYEAICLREPDNEENGLVFFSCSVICGNYSKAQQAATKLYGKFKKPKYLHWVVVSLLLQARGADDPSKQLGLAEMMLQKAPVNADSLGGKNSLNREQLYLLHLHLMTLHHQGKFARALEMLNEFEGVVKFPTDVAALRVRLLVDAGEFVEGAAAARKLVLLSPDNWAASRDYIELAFRCPTAEAAPNGQSQGPVATVRAVFSKDSPPVEDIEDIEKQHMGDEVRKAALLFRYLQEKQSEAQRSHGKGRVAYLAELEMWRAAFSAAEAVVADTDFVLFVEGIAAYVHKFAHTGSCFFDLKPYLCFLQSNHAAPVLDAVKALAAEGTLKASEEARFQQGFKRPDESASDEVADTQHLLEVWTAGGCFSSDLVAFAVLSLLNMEKRRFRSTTKSPDGKEVFLDAIALAGVGVAAAPHAFQFKVLLIWLYGILGQPGPLMKWYGTLEIKNIQHETLSYLALDVFCRCGCHDDLREICQKVVGFHEDLEKDKCEALSLSLHNAVFHRLPEYVDSLNQLGRSVLWGRAVVEEVLCDVGQAQTWEALTDALGRQTSFVAEIAGRPVASWATKNQDQRVLDGFHPLPLYKLSGADPRSVSCKPIGSMALSWSARPPPPRAVDQEGPSAQRDNQPQQLKLSASLLHAVSVLCHRNGPSTEVFTEALASAREAMRQKRDSAADVTVASISEAAARLGAEDAGVFGAPCWSASSGAFASLSWECAFLACEAASSVLRCVASGDGWEEVEKQMSGLGVVVKSLFGCIHPEATEGDSLPAPFYLGCSGAAWLWTLLHHGLAIILPVALWCTTSLPKGGGAKKAKEGHSSALHATRSALRGLLATLQAGLGEAQADLAAALAAGDAAALLPAGEAGSTPAVAALESVPDFVTLRAQVRVGLADSHRKLLQSLRELTEKRVALLKSKGSFKP